jgi:hypothetical protein
MQHGHGSVETFLERRHVAQRLRAVADKSVAYNIFGIAAAWLPPYGLMF